MRICYLAPASSIHTVRWVNAMVERGHEVSLISLHKANQDRIDSRVKLFELPIGSPLGYYLNSFSVRKIVQKIKPDIVNCHFASGYGTLSRFLDFTPTLLSVWGSDIFDFPYKNKLNRRIIEKNLQAATQIASTSMVMKREVEKLINPALQVEVTPFGIDLNKFKSINNGNNREKLTIGVVKFLEKKYGIEYIFMAVHELINMLQKNNKKDMAKKIRILIVGDGSQLKDLKNLSIELGLSGITTFTGRIPHSKVPEFLNKLDIYCAPSISESFGVSVIEASACQLPVVVSNAGGLPEVVEDGKTGYIVESKNYLEIAKKLYDLVTDEEKRIVFGKRGRERVKRLYDWNKNVDKMEEVYKQLIKLSNNF